MNVHLNRKITISGLLLLWAASLLLSCSPAPVSIGDQKADVVVFVPAGSEADAMRAAADAYQQETGRVVQVVAAGADSYFSDLEAALLAGRSDVDLAFLPASRLPRWISYRALQPFAEIGLEHSIRLNEQTVEILRPWITNLTYSSQIYGLPTQPALEALWYRSDLLDSAGLQPPATWDEFRAAAQALSQAPERYGAALAAGEFGPGFEFGAVLAGFGGQIFDTPADGVLSSDLRSPPVVTLALEKPETQQALAYYTGLFQANELTVPGSLAAGRPAAAAALQEGRAAMAILPLTMAAALLDCQASPHVCTSPEPGPARPLLAFAPLPGLPAGVATGDFGAWVIPLHAGHAQAAREFGAWLAGPTGARTWALNGGIPAGIAAGDPLVAEKAPYLALLAGVREVRLPFPPVKPAEQVEAGLRAALHAAARDGLAPSAAAAQAEDLLRRAFYQGGYTLK